MKKTSRITVGLVLVSAIGSIWLPARGQTAAPTGPAASATCPALLNHTVPRLQDGKPQSLCQYAGKVLLVVNTASYCGFTSQFEGLEALSAKHAARGLVVLGFQATTSVRKTPTRRRPPMSASTPTA